MTNLTISAGEIKVPRDARRAVEDGKIVTVTNRQRPAYVLMPADDYELVSPILERRRSGQPVPVETLLTEEDLAIIAMDAEDDLVAEGILESWND